MQQMSASHPSVDGEQLARLAALAGTEPVAFLRDGGGHWCAQTASGYTAEGPTLAAAVDGLIRRLAHPSTAQMMRANRAPRRQ